MRLAAGRRTRWGSLSAPPDSLAAISEGWGPTSDGKGGKGRKKREGRGREEKERGGERRGKRRGWECLLFI